MDEKIIKVTKVEIAKRQLKESIRMFFYQHDPISAYTLSACANQILTDLCKLRGICTIGKLNPVIRDDKREEVCKIFNKTINFFKHAYKDSDATLDFNAGLLVFNLLDNIIMYHSLKQNLFFEWLLFFVYFCKCYPEYMVDDNFKQQIFHLLDKLKLNTNILQYQKILREYDKGEIKLPILEI